MQSHCLQLDYSTSEKRLMLMEFARLSHSDQGLLNGLLLQACRHRYSRHSEEEDFQRMATAYKLQCLRYLNMTLAASPSVFSDATVANVLTLALDEVRSRALRDCRRLILVRWFWETRGCRGLMSLALSKWSTLMVDRKRSA